jgi:type IV pilus assembly protein PilC
VLFIWYKNTNNWKRQIDMFLLWLPLIWKVYRNYILSNIASTLWSLVWSWISVFKTLSLVWKSVNNSVYQDLFDEVIVRVWRWEKIVDSLREVDLEKIYFPADFTQMLSVWEKTATLEKISKKIYNQYEKEVSYSLANLTKWIEPLAILLAWIFVVWFAFAIFWAILKVTETVS